MTLRSRLLFSFVTVVVVPLTALALVVRQQMSDRLTDQFQRRIASLASVIEADLARESETLKQRLSTLTKTLVNDNRFRRAAVQHDASERSYLLDYAGDAMRFMGLAMLQIQNDSGRILSSGHFRNEYDMLEPALPSLLASSPTGSALLQARSAEGPFVTLARVDSFRLGGRSFYAVGGTAVADRLISSLAGDKTVAVTLIYPDGIVSSDSALSSQVTIDSVGRAAISTGSDLVVDTHDIPYIDETGQTSAAQILVSHPLTPLRELRQRINLTFIVAGAAATALSLVLAGWLSRKLSRPIADLARKTSEIDLHRLDVDFATDRTDEVGTLSRLLAAMTKRLRMSATSLREAERRATVGDLSRQVNHDIKNALTPIRNVLQHLTQTAHDDPAQLPAVFAERQATLDAGISYLEQLAANYARLHPRLDRRPCDVNVVVDQLVRDLAHLNNVRLETSLAPEHPEVMGDDVVLRRILENLVGNAVDSLDSQSGTITIVTELVPATTGDDVVRITVADTGPGMSRERLGRVFDDFYTTKKDGTGLGLSIVRRLVMDLHGAIKVQSEPGVGTQFTVEIPKASTTSSNGPASV